MIVQSHDDHGHCTAPKLASLNLALVSAWRLGHNRVSDKIRRPTNAAYKVIYNIVKFLLILKRPLMNQIHHIFRWSIDYVYYCLAKAVLNCLQPGENMIWNQTACILPLFHDLHIVCLWSTVVLLDILVFFICKHGKYCNKEYLNT